MTNNNISIIIDMQELKILRSAFLEICFGIKINNFEEAFSYSKNKCNAMFNCINKLLKKHHQNNEIIVKKISIDKLKKFYSILFFVKNELSDELATRTGFDHNDFDNLIFKLDNIVNK